jgi:hypothetical protein
LDEQLSLRMEKYVAFQLGVRWQDRGPIGSEDLEHSAHVEAGHDEESITDAITVATYEERTPFMQRANGGNGKAFVAIFNEIATKCVSAREVYEGARRVLQVAVDCGGCSHARTTAGRGTQRSPRTTAGRGWIVRKNPERLTEALTRRCDPKS